MAADSHRHTGTPILLHTAAVLVIAYLLFAHTVTAPLDHNEHAYLGVASLMADHRLYDDIVFIQTPLSVQVYDALLRITGPSGLLLRARLLNAVLMGVLLVAFYRSAVRLGAGPLLALLGVLFLLFNPVMMGPMKEAGNYMLALAATWGATYLALRSAARESTSPMPWLAIGVLLGLSLAAKLYHAAVWPAFLVLALWGPAAAPLAQRIRRQARPLAAGCLLGLIPLWPYLLRDFPAFWFNNVAFHTDGYNYFTEAMLDPAYAGPSNVPLAEKVIYIRRHVGLQANIAFIVCLALVGALAWQRSGAARTNLRGRPTGLLLFVALLAGLSTAAALTPNPIWIQHLAFPLPFVLLAFMYLSGTLTPPDRRILVPVLASVVIIAAAYGGIFMLVAGLKAPRVSAWTTHRATEAARFLAEHVPPDAPVATLSALYAVEADRPIYPELAMGPFVFRTAHRLPAAVQAAYPVASVETLGALLASRPPGALLVGEEGPLDASFVAFAESHGYAVTKQFEPLGLTLYLKP